MFAITLLFLLHFVVSGTALPASGYRSDYIYNRRTKAYYKLHIEPRTINRAKEICQLEGAELMVPATPLDLEQAHMMFKLYPDLEDYLAIGYDDKEHENSAETPLIYLAESKEDCDFFCDFVSNTEQNKTKCEVLTRSGEIQPAPCSGSKYPFICKVEARNAPYNELCGVYSNGYEYYESTGSCYYSPQVGISWNEAYEECKQQGGHLLVVNSEAEQKTIVDYLRKIPDIDISWLYSAKSYLLAGIRTLGTNRDFRTIFNETLERAGFNVWDEGEPNNAYSREYCGSVVKSNGKYNDVQCDIEHPFICEKEVTKEKND